MVDSAPPPLRRSERIQVPLLFLSVFVIAGCGLIYELTAGALASYVLGDSVTQFSTVIGTYLSALGLGAWLSRYITRHVAEKFVDVELAVALLGGGSGPLLFLAFGQFAHFRSVLYAVVALEGTLVGLEVPLLLRILEHRVEFKELVARVLSVDYIGALVACMAFPMFFVPRLGLARTSLVFGLLNAAVGLWTTYILEDHMRRVRALRARCALVMALLVAGLVYASELTRLAETSLYSNEIVFAEQSAYQRIVITHSARGFQLFLDGNLQFASHDEYRYHEALVHPAFAATQVHARVLVLGGGDGLALREILSYPDVREVTLVDLDPSMTRLGRSFPLLRAQNRAAFEDPRVHVVNDDALRWLIDAPESVMFDAAIVDFPDPNNFSLGKLYTTHFYRALAAHLTQGAAVAVQSTSPLFARRSYWCIAKTMQAAGLSVHPYHATVPSFGEWGFMLAKREAFPIPKQLSKPARYLDADVLASLFVFAPDMQPPATGGVDVNRLDNQLLVHYYEAEWKQWN